MSKTYVRVDDRLIHGQTIMSWAPTLKLEELIAVDDTIAANPMLKSILTMGVPKNYVTHIVTTDEARAILERAGKYYTQIKIDEIANLGAVKIRLRSLLGALEMK